MPNVAITLVPLRRRPISLTDGFQREDMLRIFWKLKSAKRNSCWFSLLVAVVVLENPVEFWRRRGNYYAERPTNERAGIATPSLHRPFWRTYLSFLVSVESPYRTPNNSFFLSDSFAFKSLCEKFTNERGKVLMWGCDCEFAMLLTVLLTGNNENKQYRLILVNCG